MELRDKRVLVVGAARSGAAATRFLSARGARVTVSDKRPLEKFPEAAELSELGAVIEAGGHTVRTFAEQDLVVVSPGVPADLPELVAARETGILVIPEIELAYSFLKGRIVGITGSNGKTTTTALTGKLLESAGFDTRVGGNIGTPLISQVEASRPETIHVVELSSFQLETVSRFRPWVAVVLNMTPDHLDRHGTFEAYAAAKAKVFASQTKDDFAVLNADDEVCTRWASSIEAHVRWFSRRGPVVAGAYVEDGDIVYNSGASAQAGTPAWAHTVLGVEEIPLRGAHNVENVLAAVCAAAIAGAGAHSIRAAVRDFPGVEHRLEYVAAIGDVRFYNDSKATNVDAAVKALEAFHEKLLVILGGKDKDSDYTVLRPLLAQKARQVLLIGAAAEKIASQLGPGLPLLRAGTLDRAVDEAMRRAQPGDVVLLSPACASFDQFENYEHRGRVFKELVHKLEKERAAPGR